MKLTFLQRKNKRIKARENEGRRVGLDINNCSYAVDMAVWGMMSGDGSLKGYAYCTELKKGAVTKIQVDPINKKCLESDCRFYKKCAERL